MLSEVSQALNVIDRWNRTHPNLMISPESTPIESGGPLFIVGGDFDSHYVDAVSSNLISSLDISAAREYYRMLGNVMRKL